MHPSISVVVPVYNGGRDFERCLTALANSSEAPLEVLVVNDGSEDGSQALAEQFGARILTTGGRKGPAVARNLGAREAKGDVLYFIDADVCVHADSVGRVIEAFGSDPELDALMGSYDDEPAEPGFLSQYKNLMHCYVHQAALERASTFWSGCGAIRRELFIAHRGFDEKIYRRPAIEDIELGSRLFQANRKLKLDKQLLVKHLKRWTFWNLIKTDVFDRGIPWTELILRNRRMPNDLNLQSSQRLSVALSFVCVALMTVNAFDLGFRFLTPLFALALFVLARYLIGGAGEPITARRILSLIAAGGLLTIAANHYNMLAIVPAVLLGYVSLIGSRWRSRPFWMLCYVLAVSVILAYMPVHPLSILFLLTLGALVALNARFYLFLARRRGPAFALSAVPFHLLYHFYSGVSFLIGATRYGWKMLASAK